MPVDYEHGQDLAAPKGLLAPAAGWIEDVDVRDGAIWAQIEWTERAAKLITDRAYRFLSASMRTTSDNRVLSLRGAALVNRPALRVEPLQTEPDEAETAREASQLICLAREHLADQTALGRKLTLTDAILSVRDGAHGLPHLPQDRKETQ